MNAKRLLDLADADGKVTFEIFTEDPRIKKEKAAKPVDKMKPKTESNAIKTKEDGVTSSASSSSKDPKVLVAYLEEQLKSAPDMLVVYLEEQLKLAKEAVAAEVVSASVTKEEDGSSSDSSSAMSESDSDSDGPPEETSIKPQVPISVPPPRREGPSARPKPICQNYKKGRCKFGAKCKFSHDRNTPNQPRNPKAAPKTGGKPARKSLLEVASAPHREQESLFADVKTDGGQ